MCLIPVPYGTKVSVRFLRENDRIYVEVHAPLYVKKIWKMPHCYTNDFSIDDILRDNDFIRVLSTRYSS